METPPDVAQALADLPAGMRSVLEAELAAGNAVVKIGAGFPAAPVGFWVKLEKQFKVAGKKRPAGIDYYDRNTSDWSEEVYDELRHFFLLSPPKPFPVQPTMDEIRAAHAPGAVFSAPAALEKNPQVHPRSWWVEVDGRGEMMTYREADRWVEIFWGSMTSGAIERASLRGWFTKGASIPMTSAEEELVLKRLIESARVDHGINVTLR